MMQMRFFAGWQERAGPNLLVIVLLLLVPAAALADDAANVTTTTPERTGGHVYFETTPSDAEIWLDGNKIGTSPFTYYSETTGTFDVVVKKRLYEDYSGTVTVPEGQRVWFSARLIPVPSQMPAKETPSVIVTTATVPAKESPVTVPTPWPSPAESPAGLLTACGALILCGALVALRRR